MDVRGIRWLVLGYGFFFLVLTGRGEAPVAKGAFLACALTLALAYGTRAFMRLPHQGFSRMAALDMRRWPPQERRRFLYESIAAGIATAALVVAGWVTGK